HVSAKDLGTGREQAMTITGGTALPKEEIEKMIKDAERFAEEDRRRRELAEARNFGDNLAYQTDKSLKEHGSKLPEAERNSIESALSDLRDALKGEDVGRIRSASDALAAASHKLAEQIYAQAQQARSTGTEGPRGTGGAGGSASDEEVVDAEIVDDTGRQ
ncbi:MAG: Hsp70 family protein, partial [Candidatus Methylomirabilales bacterium]